MTNSDQLLPVAVCYASYTDKFSYYDDWKDAFETDPQFAVSSFDLADNEQTEQFRAQLGQVKAIVLLHSTNADGLACLNKIRHLLKTRQVPLLVFVGNELNLLYCKLSDKIHFLEDVAADFIATQLPLEAGQWLYSGCTDSQVVALPHGLNPQAFRAETANATRALDIGVRSARYQPFLGDDDRNRLFSKFLEPELRKRFRIDISTEQRLSRSDWARFLNQCKATLSNEAGSWFLEKDDSTAQAIREYLNTAKSAKGIVIRADSPLQRVARYLPRGLKDFILAQLRGGLVRHEVFVHEQTEFAEVYERFFKHRQPAPVYSKCISSRHFDAIGTQCAQILLRGRYNNILEADVHYFALESDFSNLSTVLERFEDPVERQAITECALALVMQEHTYAARTAAVHKLLAAAAD